MFSKSVTGREDELVPKESAKEAHTQAAEAFFLYFFAYLHLTEAAVNELGPVGFSLTKHRILGFASLTPGITVGELLRLLRVTHQNLNEPLRRLIQDGYLVAKIGAEDRRHKCLFATAKGSRLYRKVLDAQLLRFEHAFKKVGPAAAHGFFDVHQQMIEAEDRKWIEAAMSGFSNGM